MWGLILIKRSIITITKSIYDLSLFYKIAILFLLVWSAVISILAQTVGVFLFVLVSLIFVILFNGDKQQFTGYFVVSLIITSICAVGIFYIQTYLTGSSLLANDSSYYLGYVDELVTNYRIEYLVTDNPIDATYNFFDAVIPQTGFIYLIATITKIFCGTTNILFFNIVVAVLSSLVVLTTAKIADATTNNEKIVKISVFVVMLYPVFLLYSGVLLKETLVILLIVCIAYNIITIDKKTVAKSIILLVLFAFFLYTRYRIGIALFAFCFGVYVLPWNEKFTFISIGRSIKNRWYVLLICAIVSYVLYKYCYAAHAEISAAAVREIPKTDNPETLSSILKYAHKEVTQMDGSGSVGFWSILYKIPSGLRQIFAFFFILFYPFNFFSIFSATSDLVVRRIFMDLGTLYWLICLPSFIVGSYVTLKNKRYNNINIYFIAGIIAMMAIVLYISVRWKLMVWPFLAILIAIGFIHRKDYKKLWIVSIIATAVITCIYLLLNLFFG